MRRLAIRSALSAKAGEGELKVVRGLDLDAPKTRAVKDMLASLDFSRSTLVVTAATNRNLLLSSRNLPGAKALAADYLNVADLISYHGLLMTEDAVRRAEALWGGERASRRIAPVPEAVHG
jgi:large subunit ribosomal protein L4